MDTNVIQAPLCGFFKMYFLIVIILVFKVNSSQATAEKDPCDAAVTDNACTSLTVNDGKTLTMNSSSGTITGYDVSNRIFCVIRSRSATLPTQFILCGNLTINGELKLVGNRTVSIQSRFGDIVINSSEITEVYCTGDEGKRKSCEGLTDKCDGCDRIGGGGGGKGAVCNRKCAAANAHSNPHNTSILLGGNPGCYYNSDRTEAGGGAIELKALKGRILIESVIDASGESVTNCDGGGGGGGTIRLSADQVIVSGNGKLIANGGNIRTGCDGGGGGIIHIIANSHLHIGKKGISVQPGLRNCVGNIGLFIENRNESNFPYETIGCFEDNNNDRAIPIIEGEDPNLDGYYKDRKQAVIKCYKATKSRGFKVFAVQDGGQCTTGMTAAKTFNKHRISTACLDDGEGGPLANQVYYIKDYHDVGCYKSNPEIQTLEGKDKILDGSYRAYRARKNAIANCALAARRAGFIMFALQDGGRCLASATAPDTYDKYEKSDACYPDGEGGPLANEVYLIKQSNFSYETIGCFQDNDDRAIPTLEREDPNLDGDYKSRKQAVKKCYDAAKRRTLQLFAVQDGGQCAATNITGAKTFDKYGISTACRDDGEGGTWANQVYYIKDYEDIGCFKDTHDRAIQTLEGKDKIILDGSYRARKNAIAKCALAARRAGFIMFALQDGGSCAASATAPDTYDKYGTSDDCHPDGEGGRWANEVYLIRHTCNNYTFGNVSDRGIYRLEETKYNKKVALNCDYGPPGETIDAHCIYPWNQTADTQWKLHNEESCWNRAVAILEFAKVKVNESAAVYAIKTVARMMKETENLKTNEIGSISMILANIANVTQTLDREAAEDFYQIINAMLYINETKLLTSQRESNSSNRMLVATKELSEKRSFSKKNGTDISLPNIAVSLAKVDSKTDLTVYAQSDIFRLAKPPNVSVSMTIPKKSFENKDGETSKVVFILYRSTGFFLVDGKEKAEIRSYVIAASVLGKEIKDLETPIVIRYPKKVSAGLCVFWDFAANQRRGDWSTAGCKFFKSDEYDECHCNHLTNFAMLLDVKPDEMTSGEQKSLSIISYVGCSVSLLGIVLTIATMFYFKELLASKCSKIFLNICIALAAALAVFLGAAERSKTFSNTHCIAAGMMNHFFFLAALIWMVLEAYAMYLAFVKVLPKESLEGKTPPLWGCCLICWGIPAVIVGITAGLSYNSYSNGEYCFLQGMPMVIAFFIPVVLCIFINTVAFTGIFRSLLKSGTTVTSTLKISGVEQARRGIAISVFLGLTWISGAFAISEAKLIFQYIFCITNSLQGWLIFLFYIVLSTEVRSKFRTRFFGASSGADHVRSPANAIMMKEMREGTCSTTDGTSLLESIDDMIDIRDAAVGRGQKHPTK